MLHLARWVGGDGESVGSVGRVVTGQKVLISEEGVVVGERESKALLVKVIRGGTAMAACDGS